MWNYCLDQSVNEFSQSNVKNVDIYIMFTMIFVANVAKQKENLVRKILQIQARYRVLKYDTFSARGGQGLHIFPVFPVFINPNYMGGGGHTD